MTSYTKVCGICRRPYETYSRQYTNICGHFSNKIKTIRRDEFGALQEDNYTLCPSCADKIFGFIDKLKGEIV